MSRRAWGTVGIAVATMIAVSGCEWSGLNSVPLPGAAGRGEDSFSVTIEMPDVTTISPNSPVLVADVTVGSITAIETDNWHAKVTVSLDNSVALPANSVARIGQTSLLGSKHIALAPPSDVPPEGHLEEGAVIPLASASVYPTTEEALTALSVVLNGGGLAHVQTITTELNNTLGGREESVRDLLSQLDSLSATLDGQRDAMVRTMANLDGFAGDIASQREVLGRALDALDPAMTVLAQQRGDLTAALASVDRFGAVGTDLARRSREDLKANLEALEPTLEQVVAAGPTLIDNLGNLTTFPFPQVTIDQGMRGDYANLWVVVDLTAARLQESLFFGTPLGPPIPTTNGEVASPLTSPLGTDTGDGGDR
ncbi:MCE family protein [Rhodococcus sp. RD6.2]|uniref:MCE family protein n=1 Tax=Rhodococcus sp. RD6.2 TaxID=260936 RepID=UPI000679B486|nr:MCE family protein [Rhodococcus sp. RD6.2]